MMKISSLNTTFHFLRLIERVRTKFYCSLLNLSLALAAASQDLSEELQLRMFVPIRH